MAERLFSEVIRISL